MSLATVRKSIEKAGADWTAAETSVSRLSTAEIKKMLGLNVKDSELRDNAAAISAAEGVASAFSFTAPAAIDWRNHNGGNWVTVVKDQKTCGSCVAFATCSTMESRARITSNTPNLDVDLSENQLFFCGCGKCCNQGWFFEAALNFAKTTGVAANASSTYTPVDKPCPSASSVMKVTNFRKLLSTAERKNSLATKGPLVAGMSVFSDFMNYAGGLYRKTSNTFLGNHAICMIGYDSQGWICKNSWNTGWGDDGFFRVAYGDGCGIDLTFPSYEVDVSVTTPPPPPCASYITVLQQVLLGAQTNPGLKAVLRFHICNRGTPTVLTPARKQIVDNVQLILSKCPHYRSVICNHLG